MPQPGIVTAGLVFEHHMARSNAGLTHGVNVPLITTLTDTGGGAHNGTLTGFAGTTLSGYTGSGVLGDPFALVGDGNDYVVLADLGICEDKVFSFEAWFRSTTAAVQSLVREAGATAIAGLRLNSAGLMAAQLTPDSGGGQTITGPAVNDGLWHHGVMVCDGTYVTLYTDGAAGTPTAMPAGTYSTTVTRLGNNSSSFIGSIAVARAYSTALSAADVAQNRAAGYLWAHDWKPGSTAVAATRHVLKVGSIDVPVVL